MMLLFNLHMKTASVVIQLVLLIELLVPILLQGTPKSFTNGRPNAFWKYLIAQLSEHQ